MPITPIGPIVAPLVLTREQDYGLGRLPARDGFNVVERGSGLCWLSKGAQASLHFGADHEAGVSLELRIYAGPHAYPVGNAIFEIDDAPVPVDWRAGADQWGTAFLGPFTPRQGANKLAIRLPAKDPAAAAPSSWDPRELTFAIASLRVLTAT